MVGGKGWRRALCDTYYMPLSPLGEVLCCFACPKDCRAAEANRETKDDGFLVL